MIGIRLWILRVEDNVITTKKRDLCADRLHLEFFKNLSRIFQISAHYSNGVRVAVS